MSELLTGLSPMHVDKWNLLVHWPHLRQVLERHGDVLTGKAKALPPVTVEVDPMDACNHSCTWCFTAIHRLSDSMPSTMLSQLVDELAQIGVKSVHFAGGGEPTTYPNLIGRRALHPGTPSDPEMSVIRRAHDAGMTLGLITNGSRLHLVDQQELIESLAWLRCSIDAGSDERYTAIHAPKGHDLSDIHNSLRRLIELRAGSPEPSIGASFIVEDNSTQVFDEIQQFASDMQDIGVDYVQVKPELSNRGSAADEFMSRVHLGLQGTLKRGSTFAMLNAPYESAQNADYCWYSYLGPVVGAEGSVYVCCYTYGQESFRYGTLQGGTTFSSIWDSKGRRELAAGIVPRTCTSCRHSTANLLIEKMAAMSSSARNKVSEILAAIDRAEDFEALISPDVFWMRDGFNQYARLRTVGYNRFLDFPTFRPTLFIGSPR